MPNTSPTIAFAFLPYGASLADDEPGPGRLVLDVGNALRPGVVDHHHLPAYTGSAANLVLLHPDFVSAAAVPAGQATTIVLHESPDLDCLIAAYFARSILQGAKLPPAGAALACYADAVDGGYQGMSFKNPFSLYAAYLQLAHRHSQYEWPRREDMWTKWVTEGLRVVEYVAAQVAAQQRSVLEIDAFNCPGLFGRRDRDDVRSDMERYAAKLAYPACAPRIVRLGLPSRFGGAMQVDGLLVRHVQDLGDPDRCIFFKDWARSDKERSPGRTGFTALSVASETAERRRAIISVKPDSGVSLRGLGGLLDQAESVARVAALGYDDRKQTADGVPIPKRPGCDNADPWYDGRAHAYTIVDAPRSGSFLSLARVEEIFLAYGNATDRADEEIPAAAELNSAGAPEDVGAEVCDAQADCDAQISRLSHLAQAGKATPRPARQADIFISYPRTRFSWTAEHLYAPLCEHYGKERIFFDVNSLRGGSGWLASLAEGVERCRVLLAVYCADYFKSPFCQWELQLAITRDPIGQNGVILPLWLEKTPLPAYCKLIHVEIDSADASTRFADTLLHRVDAHLHAQNST